MLLLLFLFLKIQEQMAQSWDPKAELSKQKIVFSFNFWVVSFIEITNSEK